MYNNRKKLVLSMALLVAIAVIGQAETVRLGLTGAVDFMEKPDYKTILQEYGMEEDIWVGCYWEVLFGHFGFGGTYMGKFDRYEAELAAGHYDWVISWISSVDFRYHLFTKLCIDPFVEIGFGSAGSVLLPYEEEDTECWCEPEGSVLNLSLFGDIGVGLAFRLKRIHVGGKLNYYFMNEPVPATQFEPYPMENFIFSLFAGVNF